MKNTIKYITLLSLGLLACEPEFDQPVEDTPAAEQENGKANFSKFVALGDSLTAGFADGALYIDGQNDSFANMIATQMQAAGGGTFTSPLMNDNIGGLTGIGPGFGPRLIFDAVNEVPVEITGEPSTTIAPITGPFNNMGIPGAKSFHLLADTYGDPAGLTTDPVTANPYYVRMASSPTTSPLAGAASQAPTFFSLWIGANDVLGYATDGADSGEGDAITDNETFELAYTAVVTTLIGENGAKGLLTNIPYVTSLPFFTTVPHNPVTLTTDEAAALNSNLGYGAYNAGLLLAKESLEATLLLIDDNDTIEELQETIKEVEGRIITFNAGEDNAVVIVDEDLTDLGGGLPNYRQATEDDLLVLTSRSFIGTPVDATDENSLVNGVSAPLGDKWVLTPEEQEEIIDATDDYNDIIAEVAEVNDLALYDAQNRVVKLTKFGGITVNGASVTNDYVTGGFFSLDGIHLSPKGNGITANEMIEAINDKYGSTLKPVATRDLPGVYLQ